MVVERYILLSNQISQILQIVFLKIIQPSSMEEQFMSTNIQYILIHQTVVLLKIKQKKQVELSILG
jgi:hypothetical protein